MNRFSQVFSLILLATAVVIFKPLATAEDAPSKLLNVSYDPTREFYVDFNKSFATYWKNKTGKTVEITQSHGGSAKQARSVIDGLAADVVTLGIPSDIDALAEKGQLLDPNWASRLPNNSSPYTSTVVFLVRKGNPKGIKDWPDLLKDGVEIVTPNPKTSSGGRWNYLAAFGYAFQANEKDQAKASDFIKQLYGHVKVLDAGARGSTITFVERGQGDVLLAWENEALLSVNKLSPGQFEIVYPSVSVLAEPPAAVVDANAAAHGTTEVATEYLKYLYSPEGQDVAGRNYYRPRLPEIAAKYSGQFPKLNLFSANDLLGDWKTISATHFQDGGLFDQIYVPGGSPK